MNSNYFDDLDEYELDNEESIRPKWQETRGCKIGLNNQSFQPFRKEFLHNNKDNYIITEDRIESFYREKEIIIKTFENQKVPPPFLSWASASFPPPILDSIEQLQFKNPTVIQSVVFPIILSGYDVIGIAQTGSGKTIAYLLPGLIQITSQRDEEVNKIKNQTGPQMLILVPTRELAIQIDSEIQLFTQNYRLKTFCVYGGLNNRKTQYFNLKKSPNILIATPGRLLDFLQDGATTLVDVSYLVIDEADRLLEMGFEDTIREIVQKIRQDRQTVFFSATWPKAVKHLAFDFCQQSPIYVQIGKSNLTINKNIDQEIICLFSRDKLQQLLEILDTLKISDKVLIFSDQKYRCEQLAQNMADKGYYTIALHGDKTQPQRDDIMKAFRNGQTRLLCATDLASRGLDVTDITVVINYDFPKYFDDYIHRIGRTGRGEKKGKSFSFLAYDKDEPKMARELLKLAQIVNLKYDESTLQNFASGIFPQNRNEFEFDRFRQQSGKYNQRGNLQFTGISQEQYNVDNQRSRYSRNSQNDNKKLYNFQNKKEDQFYGDSNKNFNYKYQQQNNQQNRDQYLNRNQWHEDRNLKDHNLDKDENRQNYYHQRGDRQQYFGKQERGDRQFRQELQFDQNSKFGSDQKERYYQNDKVDQQDRQQRQFRQQGEDWSQRFEGQQRQIGQERINRQNIEQESSHALNKQDKQRWQQGQKLQEDNYGQDRQNKEYQNDNREYKEEDRRIFNNRQDKSLQQQYERKEIQFDKTRENKRVTFINQKDNEVEQNEDFEDTKKQQQLNKIPFNNNSFKQENQRNNNQQLFWSNQQQQLQSQRISGTLNKTRNFDNQGEDSQNSRQEECKRQYTNQADEGQGRHRFQNEKVEQTNYYQKDYYNQNQVKFEQGGDRKHYFNNNFDSQFEDNHKIQKSYKINMQQRVDVERSQQCRNYDQRNYNYNNQSRNYNDQNEKRNFENFRDKRRFNNEFTNNERYQNDKKYNAFDRQNRYQIEQNGNIDNKFKTYRNTQSLDRYEQIKFYNSKQITRNVTKADDSINSDQLQRSQLNIIQRNRNDDTKQQNQQDIKYNKQDMNPNLEKQIAPKKEKLKEMEAINEIQEYNFNYDPNKSSSDNSQFNDFDKIEKELNDLQKYEKFGQDTQNETLPKNINIPIPTLTGNQQNDVIKQQYEIIEDDTNNIQSNVNQIEENKRESSDNEFDFTKFSRSLEEEAQMQFNKNQDQQLNNNRDNGEEEIDCKQEL